MGTQIQVVIDGRFVRQGLQNLSAAIPEVGRLQIYRTAQRIYSAMKVKGAKPTYPIQWDSEKQRRAFFASDGFGGGIPHKRIDQYVNAWTIERIGDMGYRIKNESPGAEWIAGDSQSRIHRGRWPVFRYVIGIEVQKLPEEITREIVNVSRLYGW